MMNNDDFRWDCIKGTRAIKDALDAKFATMTDDEIVFYINSEAERIRKTNKNREKIKEN
ncbi:hypothetical protein R83H12_00485 [Fibrobacteria bacterium R8-3-H12]